MAYSRSISLTPSKNLVSGLDSLRCCAALSVAVSHLASNLHASPDSSIGSFLWRMMSLMANGSAAVALFFVVSGFCIHFGQVNSLKIDATAFLARRGLRIGIPLIAVSFFAHLLGGWAVGALKTVLWSVYCELAYYLFYPLFLVCRRLIPMRQLLAASMVASVLTATALGSAPFMWQYGAATAVVCFPLWVAGAWLAERHSSAVYVELRSMLGWRFAALLICLAANLMEAVSPTAHVPLLVFAASGTFCWHYVPRELAQWRLVSPMAIVEQMGQASYSLYLVHILPIALAFQFANGWAFGSIVVAQAAAIGLTTSAFFFLCERPSHRLARRIGRNRSDRDGSLARAISGG